MKAPKEIIAQGKALGLSMSQIEADYYRYGKIAGWRWPLLDRRQH